MDRFRYLLRNDELVVGNYVLKTEDNCVWLAPMEAVAQASLASFRNAILSLAANWRVDASELALIVSRAPMREFDEEYSIYEPVKIIVLDDGQLALDIMVELHGLNIDEEDLPSLLVPLLTRCHATFIDATIEGSGTQVYCEISVAFGPRGQRYKMLLRLG